MNRFKNVFYKYNANALENVDGNTGRNMDSLAQCVTNNNQPIFDIHTFNVNTYRVSKLSCMAEMCRPNSRTCFSVSAPSMCLPVLG